MDSSVGETTPTHTLSVVIPFYDAVDTLGLQLEALAHQDQGGPFEVIVVDNMSPVSPAAIVKEWAQQLDIRVVEAKEAQGVSCARNVGIREARSEAIAFLDSDDVAGPTFIAAARIALRHADVVTGSVMSADAPVFEDGLSRAWKLLPVVDDPGRTEPLASPDYPILMGGACAMTREAALRLKGFDQRFFPGAEDNDLAIRAVRSGETVRRCPGMTLVERRRSTLDGAFRRSFAAGQMHLALCEAHDLWDVSPHLRNPTWWVDALRLPAAGLVMLTRPRTTQDWRGFAERAGLRLGQLAGFPQYRLRRHTLVPQLGIGLTA